MENNDIISFISNKRKELNLSQGDVAHEIGYSSQIVYNWEKNKSLPDLCIISSLCNCFKISIDDFFNCNNNSIVENKLPKFNVEKFSYNLKKLRMINGLTQNGLAKKLGVSYATIISWEKGKSTPNINQFIILKNLFNITYNDLYYGSFDVIRNKSKKKLGIILSSVLGTILSACIVVGTIYYFNNNEPINPPIDDPTDPMDDPDEPDDPIDDPEGKTYIAKFVDNDKTTLIWSHTFKENESIFYGTSVPENKEDECFNHLFMGWDYNCDGLIDDINLKITSDMTLLQFIIQ